MRLANVRLLGRQPYARLPSSAGASPSGSCPSPSTSFTRDINPIKLREYLSAGLPVVATALPEVAAYAPLAAVTRDAEEFIRAVETALAEDSPARRVERSGAMLAETWEEKVAALGRHVMRVRSRAAAANGQG